MRMVSVFPAGCQEHVVAGWLDENEFSICVIILMFKTFKEDHMGRDEEWIGGTKLRYKLLFSMHLNPITISCVFGLGIVGIVHL